MQRVADTERQLGGDASLPLARAVARSRLRLMSKKDEYEVARLYTDGQFRQALQQAHQRIVVDEHDLDRVRVPVDVTGQESFAALVVQCVSHLIYPLL